MRHHDERWDRGWRRMEAMARRGFRGFGQFDGNMGPGGEWGGFGGNFRIGRMLASGDLRLVALYLIEQQPRHGYDLIKAIEEKSQGFYSPEPRHRLSGADLPRRGGLCDLAGRREQEALHHHRRRPDAPGRQSRGDRVDARVPRQCRHADEPRGATAWRAPTFRSRAEQAEKLRGMGKRFAEGRWFGEDGPPPHPGHRAPGHEHPGHWQRPGEPDRDIADVGPEVNEARKALKKAIKAALKREAGAGGAGQRNPAPGGGGYPPRARRRRGRYRHLTGCGRCPRVPAVSSCGSRLTRRALRRDPCSRDRRENYHGGLVRTRPAAGHGSAHQPARFSQWRGR